MGSANTRVVTEVNEQGKSVFAKVGPPPAVAEFFGFVLSEMWRLDAPPATPADGYDPPEYKLTPAAHGVVFRTFAVPPDDQVVPHLAAIRAQVGDQAEIDLSSEAEYGMHQTATIDFITVISGEVDLRLDDQQELHLKPGDCVVQRGTRHAWRNRGKIPCLMSAVLVGAPG